ncbi:MAG TPA: CCA tRNA nucleotidyltransferase [Actinobacteria bacterium]|nr:CCA tRNA nucleotidyltransferase [Actinomycetota bacterium]
MFPKRLEPLLRADGVPMRVAARFAEAGHELYLVGGSVRDALLGRTRTEAEFDFTTDASPDQIHDLLKGWAHGVVTVGKEFGTVGGRLDDVSVEITTFRSERYRDDSRKPEVAFTDDLEVDLSRRDFTVNAIALRLMPEPEMVDPFGGLVDLGKAVLRTPLSPEVSFGDDPLRMLRLFRFAATLGFTPDAAAVAAVRAMADRLEIVSAERIREEFDRLIVGDHVEGALWGVVDTGLAARFLPEVPALAVAQDPHHRHKDVLAHTIAVVGKCPSDRIVRLGALFHDVGKPATREISREGVTFHHHEVVGARLTRARMRELRYANEDVDLVSDLVYLHMRAHTFRLGWTDRAVRRYVRDAGPLLDRLNVLVRCDVTTANDRKARQIAKRVDELEERIADLREREELDSIRPPLDGHEVMTYLGVKPGPIVGEALEMLLEHRLDHGPFDSEEAYSLLERWADARGLPVAGYRLPDPGNG